MSSETAQQPTGSQHKNEPCTNQRKVLIAIDGSDHADAAFKWYVSNVYQEGDTAILAYTPEYQGCIHMPVMAADANLITKMISEEEKNIRLLMGRMKEMLHHAGVNGSVERLTGQPGEEIIKCAVKENVTLIVTGSRGLGKIRRTFLGSVSDYVMHHAHVPVLVCKLPETN